MVDHISQSSIEKPPMLPKSPKIHEQLLSDAREIISRLSIVHRHQLYLAETIRLLSKDAERTLRERDARLEEVMKVGNRLWAESIPPLKLLWPYLDMAKHSKIIRRLPVVRNELCIAVENGVSKPHAVADALESMAAILQKYINFLIEFRGQVMDKMELQADTCADGRKKTFVKPPENGEIIRLHMLLENGVAEEMGMSVRAFAIDLYEGDQKKADSNLRQVRRYRKKLKEAEK